MVGPLIEARLQAMRRSQADLVRELQRRGSGVTKQSVSAWIAGKARPDDRHMHELFAVFVVPLDQQPAWWAARGGREVVDPGPEDGMTVAEGEDTPCTPGAA